MEKTLVERQEANMKAVTGKLLVTFKSVYISL
jgi:hypothetical protein